jgi:PD-(D/E)XK nuclease superfamily
MNLQFPDHFDFSQSSLQDYADCPRRFQLRYLERLEWPAIEAEPVGEFESRQQEGLVFHRLVQQHLLGLPAELVAASARSPDLQRWWHNFLAADLDLEGCTVRPELNLFAAIRRHRLVAKYDLVAIRDGEATIYDWKTYARRPSNESMEARWQTKVYRALMARAATATSSGSPPSADSIRMVYWFSEFPADPAIFTYDARQFQTDWAAIEKLVREISSARDFPLTDNRKRCRFCAFRSYCDRGKEAAAWDASAAELDAGDVFDISFDEIDEIAL